MASERTGVKSLDLPPLCLGDTGLANRARLRPSDERHRGRSGRIIRPDSRTVICGHCGRTWTGDSRSFDGNNGRVVGFLVSAAMNHANTCVGATPEERRAIARIDMRRWARSRANRDGFSIRQLVTINFNHQGFGDEPIFEDPSLRHFGASLGQSEVTHGE